jgi:hypothetical protein
MSLAPDAARVRRLLAWYPARWRHRYGEEFGELLAAELAERPRCWQRTVNIAASGLRARLAGAGLASHPLDPAAAARAGLATLACSVAAFGVVGAAIWSQLALGLQWAVPADRGITQSLDLMSAALLLLGVLGVLAAIPVIWAGIAACARGTGRRLVWPGIMLTVAAAILVTGGRHFQNGWPGTGGHLLAHQGLVPGGIAAFGWATTMWITSYWAHPAMLAAFPLSQIAWMVLSAAASGCMITGAVQLLHRIELSPRTFRYEIWLGNAAWAGMAAFLAGALSWFLSAGTRTPPLFHAGAVDEAGIAVLAIAITAGVAAGRRARFAAQASPAGSARPVR